MEAHIPGIGVENFRIFEKEHYFNFAPITLLTGANSSGKSSLIKALKFMHEVYSGVTANHFSDYTQGDIEKLFTQNKSFNFQDHPLIKAKSYVNKNIDNGEYCIFYEDEFPFIESVKLITKITFKASDFVQFKKITMSISHLGESKIRDILQNDLEENENLTLDYLIGKEILSLEISEIESVEVKMNIFILNLISNAKIYLDNEYHIGILHKVKEYEELLNKNDSEKLRKEIEVYYAKNNSEIEIVKVIKDETVYLAIKIFGKLKTFRDGKGYLLEKLDSGFYKSHQVDILKNDFYDIYLTDVPILVEEFKGKLEKYYSEIYGYELQRKFERDIDKFLSGINWTNRFATFDSDILRGDNFFEQKLKTEFINFEKNHGKGFGSSRIPSNNIVLNTFSLNSIFHFLYTKKSFFTEGMLENFDLSESFYILKEEFFQPLSKRFYEELICPLFYHYIKTKNKKYNTPYQFNLEEHKSNYLFRNLAIHDRNETLFKKLVSQLTSFKSMTFISNDRASDNIGNKINSLSQLQNLKDFNSSSKYKKDDLRASDIIFRQNAIIKFLKEFDIADDLNILIDEETMTYKILLEKDGVATNLNELGYGISKLVPLIFDLNIKLSKIEYTNQYGEGWDGTPDLEAFYEFSPITIVIEEPESNLHPALQSKLADMFVELSKTFNIQFIIETHSEYLIRKFQYLTAKKVIEPKDTQIHYFYHPDKVPLGETQTYPINITKDGALTKGFGTGFYDEAGNIALDLFLLKSEQGN